MNVNQSTLNQYLIFLISFQMGQNPWEVDSIQAFSFLKCPECIYDVKEKETFQDHAIENHPLSHLLFSKIIKEDEIEIKEELSEINSNTSDNEKVFEDDQKLIEEIMPYPSENFNLENFQRFVFENEGFEDLNFVVPFEENQKPSGEIMPDLSEDEIEIKEELREISWNTSDNVTVFEDYQTLLEEIMPYPSENFNLENLQKSVFKTESSEDLNFVVPFEENQKPSVEIMPDLRENSNSENVTIETDDDSIPSFDEEQTFIPKRKPKTTKLPNKTD